MSKAWVRVSFYYVTSEKKIKARPDYRRSVAASLREAIMQHAPNVGRRVRNVKVRVEVER